MVEERSPTLSNCYEDPARARAYGTLDYPGTYHLAFRDIPALLQAHAPGSLALDFGCGAGRSTRLLRKLGWNACGVDSARNMVEQARLLDPEGVYHLVDDDLAATTPGPFDLVFCAFPFDNIDPAARKLTILRQLCAVLRSGGCLVSIVSTPEIYTHEWASFTTRDFPENRRARSGERVKIVMKDVDDARPVEDVVCSDEDYRRLYAEAGLRLTLAHRPLGRQDEPFEWLEETRVAPWCVYVLHKA